MNRKVLSTDKERLDEKLVELFNRDGLRDSKKLQSILSGLANNCLEILKEQKNASFREVGMDKSSFQAALLEEHKQRIDLHIVRWSIDAKDALVKDVEKELQNYNRIYLKPTLIKFERGDLVTDDTRTIADYLLGSVIKLVIDTLGKKKCYVPDSEEPSLFSSGLLKQQMEILRIMNEKYPAVEISK